MKTLALFITLSGLIFVGPQSWAKGEEPDQDSSLIEIRDLGPRQELGKSKTNPENRGEKMQALFLGASLGSTTTSNANGGQSRSDQTSYGFEVFKTWNHWMAGLDYKYISTNSEGNKAINVAQYDNWLSAEGRYRIWDQNFSPYVSIGAGSVVQSISTTVFGSTNDQLGFLFVKDVGLGLLGQITNRVGVNVSARYFQYSNVNGFDYTLSLGIFL